MPITILAQIVQYLSFLEHSEVAHHNSVLESIAAGGGVQGLCAGLLSAHAVASATTTEDVVAVSCTSLRLAFCVGAYVDADQVSNDGNAEATSLAVRWKEPTTLEDIQEVLLNHQNTYIAVTRDERDVTITTPTVTAAMLQQNLSRLGVSFLDIGLSGRYHTSIHADVPLKIIEACQGRLDPRFGSQELVRSNFDGQLIPSHGAVRNVLESILVHHANWYLTISTSAQSLSKTPGHSFVLSIGGDTSTQSITKAHQIIRIKTIISADIFRDLPFKAASCTSKSVNGIYPADAVAVIGMACKFPGADSIDEFWGEIPTERFDRKNLPRSPRGLRFWGNFVNDIESFDHKFFKKSAREAASMDPQQQSSGYFSDLSKPRDIGCYIGSCSTDYDGNVASHPPTAYSTTGTLRAFLSGRLSHYFGWSGPSLVFDTACSSSAVAIHTACRALQAGEISQAVAGGNLSTAHFLSPSGATKPFDAEADGYCRGEGVGLVVLKRLSEALKDGDNVLGVIAGSAVNQNANCVSITRVVSQAGINPQEITFVEAHGTGTPVGDPIEMESIRELFVSSVKGNIGHLEAASGVAALIKAILQMEYRTACVQASFKKLNPRIPSLEADHMRIPTTNSALPLHPLSACVNNYGAAGSNATLILLESPKKRFQQRKSSWQNKPASLAKLPIQIAAASAASLKSSSSLNDIQRAEQQNQELAHMLTMTTPIDLDQFRMNLKQTYLATDGIKQRPQELPHVGLSKRVWEQSLRSMGYPGLYPDIFETSPIADVVVLQSATWLDSGLRLAALCVSGILSLRDGLKLVAGRASLMKNHWGSEPGTMINLTIACYNGPSSHVIAELLRHSIRHKRLAPMMSPLRSLASSLTLNKAKIRVETCTDGTSWDGNPTPELIAAHTRDPVYFGQAIQRLQDRLGPCTFLEAGSDSSVVSMVRRASTQSLGMSSNFVSIDLGKEASFENLADTTVKLWDCAHEYEKPQHWLELKTHPKTTELPQQDLLIQFSGTTEEFRALVQGHTVLGNAESVKQLGQTQAGGLISIRDLCLGTPLGLAVDRKIDLKVQRLDDSWNFHVTSIPTPSSGGNDTSGIVAHATGSAALRPSDNSLLNEFARFQRLTNSETFATVVDDPDGTSIKGAMVYNIVSQTVDYADFYRNVKSVASSGMKVTGTVLPQTNIPSQLKDSSVQPHILDSFFQVTDLHANYMNGLLGDHTFCLSGVERIQYGPDYQIDGIKTADKLGWNVVCLGSNTNNGDLSYDIYVYDRAFGSLVLLLLGCRYSQVRRTSQREMFMPAGHDLVEPQPAVSIIPQPIQSISPIDSMQRTSGNTSTSIAPCTTAQPTKPEKSRKAIIYDDMCTILENIAELKKGDIKGNMVLEDLGVDSLMMIEVISEISSFYDVELPIEDLEQLTDFNSLVEYLHGLGCGGGDIDTGETSSDNSSPSNGVSTSSSLSTIFEALRLDFDKYAEKTGFKNFWKSVYPDQARLVEAYIIDAFRELDCDITKLSCGQTLPPMNILPRHSLLMSQLRKILAEGGIITLRTDGIYERTAKRIDATSSAILFKQMLAKYPKHASETSLLNVTGSCLSQCLTGKKDPLQLLFANKANRAIMADVYDKAPMCQATTQLLAEFLTQSSSGRAIKILEVGAGTGGTAKYLVEFLTRQGIEFEYTFTDISAALVNQAKKLFAGYKTMKFMALDCDAAPPPELYKRMDVVIATNCIHATKNATSAATNVASLLRDDGVFCLVEFTRGLYWFDLVYGLLDGWWAFSDGRQHALADERFWDQSLRSAGFKHVSWSGPDGSSEEANTMRLICAFVAAPQNSSEEVLPPTMAKRAGFSFETLVWKRVGSLELKADVYYPKTPDEPGKKRPVALMIHGGGHLLFGRQDIPMKHVRVLLQRGFLPVSTDYRLCPELTLFDGPVTDCRESLRWTRETLPFIRLSEPSVTVDTSRLLALGWSSGGHLAMTLGHTAKPEGIKPPDVILPFYSPTDLEDEFWYKPNYVDAAEEEPTEIWGELDAVLEEPIVDYTPLSDKRTTALSLTLKDDRARLILHMNWKAQGIPLLIRGLPHKSKVPAGDKTDWKNLPLPPVEKIRECSPYWQILQGNYCTPTFMVHGNNDDWLPYRMTEKTIAELKKRGIPCGIIIPDQCGHAFDLFPRGPRGDPLGLGWAAIENAYNFACDQLRIMS
ncbi:hypothetical protein F4823DRAFT_633075 [Ustulina deusta]|nr:hypothetical protein F4823DRAFT_633075 [Ustulina deusta]